MALLKWIFHKSINPVHLKAELKQLEVLFQDYILFFRQKKGMTTISFPYLDIIRTLKTEFERFNKAIIKNLNNERKVKKVISIINSHSVLTKIEQDEINSIEDVLVKLKNVLQEELRVFKEFVNLTRRIDIVERNDPYGVSPEIPKLRNQFSALSKKMIELIGTEEKLLFGETHVLTELVQQVIENKEFPIIKSVSCPAIKVAILAKSYLNSFSEEGLGIDYLSNIPRFISSKESEIAFYPGSGGDPIIIFCFPNAKIYVLQDVQDWMPHLVRHLKIFARTNIIQNLQNVGNEFNFVFNGQNKKLIAHYGSEGDSSAYVSPEIRSLGVGIIMTKAFSVEDDVREAILENVIPYAIDGCYIHKGLIPYNKQVNGSFNKISKDWFQKI